MGCHHSLKSGSNYLTDEASQERVVLLTKIRSLAAQKIVKMTTSSAASHENFVEWHFVNACFIVVIEYIISSEEITTLKTMGI